MTPSAPSLRGPRCGSTDVLAHRFAWPLLSAALFIFAACAPTPAAPPPVAPAAASPAPKQAATAAPAVASPAAAKPAASPAAKPSPAASPVATAADFRGKTVRITVGYAPGGGFDGTARLLAPHLQQALPGNPTVIVDNMPGADSLVAARTILSGAARSDEVNIVVYIATLLPRSILSGGIEGFAIEKESAYLGKADSQATQIGLCANPRAAKNLDEFLNRPTPIKVGGLSGASNYDALLRWAKEAGYPIDIVFGYKGTADLTLAFDQGEIDATPACREADFVANSQWLEQDAIVPLFYFEQVPDSVIKLQAQGKFPWAKPVLDIKPVTPEQRSVLDTWNSINRGNNIYAMNKNTPPAILESVRRSFQQAVSNPEFKKQMDARQLPVGYVSPGDVERAMTTIEQAPASSKDLIKRMMSL